jgi:serine/threonine protein kinase
MWSKLARALRRAIFRSLERELSDQGNQGRYPDGTPHQLGRYRLVRPVSTGGMARVFEGRRESLAGVAPRVAVKVILPQHAHDENFRDLFVNEARIGSLLSHQNVVQIQDFDCEKGVYYLVMEFVEGVTVRKAIDVCRRHRRSIPIAVIAEVGRQVCDGLDYAHSIADADARPLFLVHRDIKPSNLIAGPQGVVKVLDFGISKALISREKTGAVRGTWGYMAPEQAEGQEVGGAADLFGLASVLFEMATLGPLIPEKEPAAVRDLMARDEPARRASRLGGAHGALASILMRALQRDPAARYRSAKEMGKALAQLGSDPVTDREHLRHFQSTIRQLAETGKLHSPGAPKVVETQQEGDGGLGIAVGNRERAHQPHAEVPVRRVVTRRRRRLTPQARRIVWSLGLLGVAMLSFWAWSALDLGASERSGDRGQDVVEDEPGEADSEGGDRDASLNSTVRSCEDGMVEPCCGDADCSDGEGPESCPADCGNVDASSSEDGSTGEEPGVADGEALQVPTDRGDGVGDIEPSAAVMSDAVDEERGGSAIGQAAPEPASEEASPASNSTDVAMPDGPSVGNFGLVTVYATQGDPVLIDGVFYRNSPVREAVLTPGMHTITIEDQTGQQHSTTLDVKAGDRIRLQWDVSAMEFKER